MIAIIDYGAGNLFSVKNALDYIGEKSIITKDISEINNADSIILPGVGAFPMAMEKLREANLLYTLREVAKTKPFLGICLGMQMLFDESFEFEKTQGLGLIKGEIKMIEAGTLKIPHIGWNELEINNQSVLLQGINEKDCVYFVHSFCAYTESENVSAYCDYGMKIPAMVENKNVYGTQFHPEKSGEVGLIMLRNFGGITK
jgi:glutamine amidotransferase